MVLTDRLRGYVTSAFPAPSDPVWHVGLLLCVAGAIEDEPGELLLDLVVA